MPLLGVTGRGNAPGDDSSGVARRPRARRDARPPQAECLRVIPGAHPPLDVSSAAALPSEVVLERLASDEAGLSASEAQARLRAFGPNALAVRRVSAIAILVRQLRNPLLLLLLAAAAVSGLTGDPTDAAIIAAIVALSVGLGFVNEYRAANAVAALHRDIHHEALVWRDGRPGRGRCRRARARRRRGAPGRATSCPPTFGCSSATQLECDEAVLTGESLPVAKSPALAAAGDSPLDLPVVRLHGHGRPPGGRARRRRLDGHGDGVRPDRRRPRRAAGRDRVPGRPARLLAACS